MVDIPALAPTGITEQCIPAFGSETQIYGWIDCAAEIDGPAAVTIGSITDPPDSYYRFESVSDLIEEMTRMLAEAVWTHQATDFSDDDWAFAPASVLVPHTNRICLETR